MVRQAGRRMSCVITCTLTVNIEGLGVFCEDAGDGGCGCRGHGAACAFASPAGAAFAGQNQPGAAADPIQELSAQQQMTLTPLPVKLPHGNVTSPAVDPAAPYTPVVVGSLIAHLQPPDNPPPRPSWPTRRRSWSTGLLRTWEAGLPAAGDGPWCRPRWGPPRASSSFAGRRQGVLPDQWRHQQGTTAPMTLMGLGSSFGHLARQRVGTDRRQGSPLVHGHGQYTGRRVTRRPA